MCNLAGVCLSLFSGRWTANFQHISPAAPTVFSDAPIRYHSASTAPCDPLALAPTPPATSGKGAPIKTGGHCQLGARQLPTASPAKRQTSPASRECTSTRKKKKKAQTTSPLHRKSLRPRTRHAAHKKTNQSSLHQRLQASPTQPSQIATVTRLPASAQRACKHSGVLSWALVSHSSICKLHACFCFVCCQILLNRSSISRSAFSNQPPTLLIQNRPQVPPSSSSSPLLSLSFVLLFSCSHCITLNHLPLAPPASRRIGPFQFAATLLRTSHQGLSFIGRAPSALRQRESSPTNALSKPGGGAASPRLRTSSRTKIPSLSTPSC